MANPLIRPPLNDVLVVDFTDERGELAGRLLAQLGATVVKVEPPDGAAARALGPFAHDTGESLYWETVAAGKRSVVADIQSPAGRDQVRPLLERADIILESSAPGVMDSLGLGPRQVAPFNPRVIYVSISPYGQDGPDAQSPATELTVEASSGLLGLQGDPDRPPVPIGYPQAAFHAGAQAAADALIALNERERSGFGQHLDVSMQAAMVWTLMNATGYPGVVGSDPPATGEHRGPRPGAIPGVSIPAIWECADGWITCVLTGGRAGSMPMQTVLSRAAAEFEVPADLLARDWVGWVAEAQAGRIPLEDIERALGVAADFFRRHTRHDLMEFGTRESLLLAAVYDAAGLVDEPQLNARGYWTEVEGRLRPGVPVRLSATPMLDPAPAPALGADQALLEERWERPRGPANPRRGRPFEGLKVADFSWVGVGPMLAKALADHGATVVHVESSSRPDLLRTLPPFKDNVPGLNRAQFMANFNTSKLGLELNLRTPEGLEVARDLVRWSDVVVESFTAGTMERMGLGYETLSADQPDLLMVSTCLRGQTGPQRTYGGYGGQGAALAGIYGVTGWPDRAPSTPWGAYTDFIAPRYGTAALAAALLHRERTGEGQHIDLAQVEAGIHFIEPVVLDYTVNGRTWGPQGHRSDRASPHGVYAAAGHERYVAIACETPAQWRALCSLAPLGAFADPAFEDLRARLECDEEIDAALGAWCGDQDAFALVERLKQAGVPAAVVQRPSDLYRDPQLAHRGFFVTLEHTEMGPTPYDGPVTRFSRTPPRLTAAPCLGEHTDEVLTSILGYSPERVSGLRDAGALS